MRYDPSQIEKKSTKISPAYFTTKGKCKSMDFTIFRPIFLKNVSVNQKLKYFSTSK